MSPIGLLLIGAGVILVFAAFRDVSPVELVTGTLAPARGGTAKNRPVLDAGIYGTDVGGHGPTARRP